MMMVRGGKSGFLHICEGKNLFFFPTWRLIQNLQRRESEAAFWDYIQLVSALQHISFLFYTQAEAVNATGITEAFL